MISVFCVGFGQGVIFPLINVKTLSQVGPYHSDKVIAIVSSMIHVGQFLSPIVLDTIGRITSNETIRFQYGAIAVGMIIAFITILMIKIIKSKRFNIKTPSL